MLGKREDQEKELDVDFTVVEVPRDTHFPRRPNVVSRRGHKVKITGYVRELKETTKRLRILAEVNVLGPQSIAPDAHLSRRMRLWGDEEITFDIPDDADLPYEFEIVIEEKRHDEHLGQGPDYEAIVTIFEEGPTELRDEHDGGQSQPTDDQDEQAASAAVDDTGTTFTISFVSM